MMHPFVDSAGRVIPRIVHQAGPGLNPPSRLDPTMCEPPHDLEAHNRPSSRSHTCRRTDRQVPGRAREHTCIA